MLTGLLWLVGISAGVTIGWIAACEWYDRHPHTITPPGRAYADDFAEHLSGRVYDQERTLAPQGQPIASRWDHYRRAN